MKRAAFLFALAACGSREIVNPPPGEVLLHVDTDAPLPAAAGEALPPDAPPPLFDRMRVEIFAPGATSPCDGCTNEFALDVDLVGGGLASFGVAPPPHQAGWRARVRMFLGALLGSDGEPIPLATVETVVGLPPVDDQGTIDVSLVLSVEGVGRPVGTLDAPADPTIAAPAPSLVGTWPGAMRVSCNGSPRAGEACVPGGAFWMGTNDTLLDALSDQDELGPHLVVLSPFFLQKREATVGDMRAAGVAPFTMWSGSLSGNGIQDYCTFSKTPGNRESLPANCVAWADAEKTCQASGAKLPTEAQYEYVASGLLGRRFPWGEDPPEACSDAVYGRAGYGLFQASEAPCKPASAPGGVTIAGQGKRDRVVLESGTITDLAGNVAEWALDTWNRHDEKCWTATGVYRDPLCTRASRDPYDHAARGGEWLVLGGELTRTARAAAASVVATPEVGFRCARPAK
ncbi:MAG TPA: formylglycine-generating enzyme family protein [Labilithrix sp.]